MGRPVLPTVEQFPRFDETRSWLHEDVRQCIWYLPDKGRYCGIGITPEANRTAADLADSLSLTATSVPATNEGQVLADIAEQCCCGRYHRNKIWGSDLADKLARRWQREIQVAKATADAVENLDLARLSIASRRDGGSPSTIGNASAGANPNPPIMVPPLLDTMSSLTEQMGLMTLARPPRKPVAFAKHEVWESDSLSVQIVSPLDPRASRLGSLYIYTHIPEVFRGMLKIGYTAGSIASRLTFWAECGHGQPVRLVAHEGVRHPHRVEVLTHFELRQYWYALRWCPHHQQSHLEWFQIDLATANSIIRLWSRWMDRANPYDRRGDLKPFWKDALQFLHMHDNPITAAAMMQIQEIQEGSALLFDFIDDDALRKRRRPPTPVARQEHLEPSTAACAITRNKADLTVKEDRPIKVEITEWIGSAGMSTTVAGVS